MGPLKKELQHLQQNISYLTNQLSKVEKEFWANGGICCPNCGVPDFTELEKKLEAKLLREEQILNKIKADTGFGKRLERALQIKLLGWIEFNVPTGVRVGQVLMVIDDFSKDLTFGVNSGEEWHYVHYLKVIRYLGDS